MAILKRRGVGIAHCPSSNMKLASGVAPVVRMLALDLAVGLGPDGPAGSNNDFNMFEEMDLAAKLQKVTDHESAGAARRRRRSRWRPSAARARSGMEKEIGSLETGKRADMITGAHRPPARRSRSTSRLADGLRAQGVDVRDVMVNGKPVVRDGRILTLNQQLILQKAAEYRAKISASLK